jgi:hypothetical protein
LAGSIRWVERISPVSRLTTVCRGDGHADPVVRITAPVAEIEQRLQADPRSGRADDLREAQAWIAAGEVLPFEDDAVVNVGPIRAVAEGILARWLDSGTHARR